MPKLGIGRNQKLTKQRGFTLVELLVVMFIISILGLALVLNLSSFRTQPYRMADLSNQFLLQIRAAQQRAILKPTLIGLHLSSDQYQFSELVESEDLSKSSWNLLENGKFWSSTLPNNLRLRLSVDGKNVPLLMKLRPIPDIIFNSNGDMSNFQIEIIEDAGHFNTIIQGQENGELQMRSKEHL